MAQAFGKWPSEFDELTIKQAAEVMGWARAEQYRRDRELGIIEARREAGMR